jgi:hypothetical protein
VCIILKKGYHRVTIEIGQPHQPPPGDNGMSTSTLRFNTILLSIVLLTHPNQTHHVQQNRDPDLKGTKASPRHLQSSHRSQWLCLLLRSHRHGSYLGQNHRRRHCSSYSKPLTSLSCPPSTRDLMCVIASMHREPHCCPRGSRHRYREGDQGQCVFGQYG